MAACIVVIIADRTRPVKPAGRRKLRLFVKHTLIQRAVLVRDDRGADRVARDVDRRARHIQDAVDAHNQPNAGNRQAESNTIASVTKPTEGTPAVPIEASVAVAMTVR